MVCNESKKETLVYILLWAALFIAPVVGLFVNPAANASTDTFPWPELLRIWKQFAVFFVAFLIHNYLLAPMLIYRQRRAVYFSTVLVLIVVFSTVQCVSRPFAPAENDFGGPPPFEADGGWLGPEGNHDFRDPPEGREFRDDKGPERPPLIVGEHDVVATIILILMIGMNLGIKLYFRQREERLHFALLERENLEQQLEYLKYQINPHFLMNTLNNIHALVDIDPEQAKETIVELSKIMRFVLYEGSKQKVPLRQELIFLENYIHLMRMRITDTVKLTVSLPEILPDREIPPLMLITFVENAFKHGVSYRLPSFIDISVSIEDSRLHFCCRNSKPPKAEDQYGGVGLQNVKRRLELIYGEHYSLDIDDAADSYSVNLTIPL